MHRTNAHISDEIPPTQRQIFRRPSYIYTSHRKVAQLWEQINCDHPTLTIISSFSRPTPTMIDTHCAQRSYHSGRFTACTACATTEDAPQLRNVRRRPPRRPTAVIEAWPYRGHASVTERSSAAGGPLPLLKHGPELVAKSITLRIGHKSGQGDGWSQGHKVVKVRAPQVEVDPGCGLPF